VVEEYQEAVGVSYVNGVVLWKQHLPRLSGISMHIMVLSLRYKMDISHISFMAGMSHIVNFSVTT
jgi:hypothetical protein